MDLHEPEYFHETAGLYCSDDSQERLLRVRRSNVANVVKSCLTGRSKTAQAIVEGRLVAHRVFACV